MNLTQIQRRMTARRSLEELTDQQLIDLVADKHSQEVQVELAAQLLAERLPPAQACQHFGCDAAGAPCDSAEGRNWYCDRHAPEHGYCPGCGQFWAGTRTFEKTGICAPCARRKGLLA